MSVVGNSQQETRLDDDSDGAAATARTLITIATYNEMENLPDLVADVFAAVPHADVLVIDDGSPDGTGDWCRERAEQDERLHLLQRGEKLGLGTATIAAMKYAIERGYDWMLNMDADYSHHPRYLRGILKLMEKADPPADVVIGSRYVPGGGTEGWPLHRRLMSRAVNLYARTLLWLRSKDVSGAFRCYRVSALKRIDFDRVRSRGYAFQEEILWHLRRRGAAFHEFPIIFRDRTRGQSKIHLGEAFSAVSTILFLGLFGWTIGTD